MSDTTFTDYATPIVAGWLNDINDHVYNDTPIAPATTVHDASLIANTPAGGIAATTVQAAIDELDTEKAPLDSPVLITPNLGTPSAGILTNCTGLPASVVTGVTAGKAQQVDQAITATTRATTTTLGTTLNHTLSDTSATITAFNGVAGVTYRCKALGGGSITHSAGLNILQGAADITTSAGDVFDVYMLTSTTCEVRNYTRARRVGEVVSSQVLVASGVALTTSTAKTVTSITLTEGEWDVTGFVGILGTASTSFTAELGATSFVDNTRPTNEVEVIRRHSATVFGATSSEKLTVPTSRVSVAAGVSTIVYLIAYATFTVSTATAFGLISARRMA